MKFNNSQSNGTNFVLKMENRLLTNHGYYIINVRLASI